MKYMVNEFGKEIIFTDLNKFNEYVKTFQHKGLEFLSIDEIDVNTNTFYLKVEECE